MRSDSPLEPRNEGGAPSGEHGDDVRGHGKAPGSSSLGERQDAARPRETAGICDGRQPLGLWNGWPGAGG